jgi:light-regulated signal transduction histidine kinase (bacteriophytochrome)
VSHRFREAFRKYGVITLCFLSCVPIFALDLATPNGFTVSILYLVPLVIAALFGQMKLPLFALGITATVLTILGFFLGPSGWAEISIFNRVLTIIAMNVTTIFGQVYIEQAIELKRINLSLQESNERLNGAKNELESTVSNLNEKTKELQRSNSELQEFAYAASHDLRQPLATVSAFMELLRDRYRGKVLDERAEKYIENAVNGSLHMAALISDLLQYARVSQDVEQRQPTDMNQVLDQVEKSLAAALFDSNAVVSHDFLPVVNAAPNQMGRLLQNLIANAIKFRGKEDPRVHVSAERKNGFWQFSVRDNGIGIDPQYADKLFKMFSRLHSQTDYEGTGIGLALVKRIAERHGGKAWFESEPGKGSTFFFTITERRTSKLNV